MPPSRLPRLLCTAVLLLAAGCGDAGPRVPPFDPPAAARRLRAVDDADAFAAARALREHAAKEPRAVTQALLAELRRPDVSPDATTFALRADPDAASRAGLPPLDAADTMAACVRTLRRRILEQGLPLGSLRADGAGVADVLLVGARPAEVAAALAADLARRGVLELRLVCVAPRTDEARAAFDAWLAAESAAWAAAEGGGPRYVPTRGDRLVVPEARPSPRDENRTPDVVPVEVPSSEAERFGDEDVASASVVPGPDGTPRVRLVVHPARRAALEAFTKRHLRRELAVVRDGVVTERLRLEQPANVALDLRPLGAPAADAARFASGRLPRPLQVVPAAEAATRDPGAAGLVRALAETGAAAKEALDELARDPTPSRARGVAVLALAAIRARAEAQPHVRVPASPPPGSEPDALRAAEGRPPPPPPAPDEPVTPSR